MLSDEYKQKLRELRKAVRGHYEEIAEACNVSPSTVSRVLLGEFNNDKVIARAVKVRERLIIKQERDLKKKISKM